MTPAVPTSMSPTPMEPSTCIAYNQLKMGICTTSLSSRLSYTSAASNATWSLHPLFPGSGLVSCQIRLHDFDSCTLVHVLSFRQSSPCVAGEYIRSHHRQQSIERAQFPFCPLRLPSPKSGVICRLPAWQRRPPSCQSAGGWRSTGICSPPSWTHWWQSWGSAVPGTGPRFCFSVQGAASPSWDTHIQLSRYPPKP